MVVTDLYDAADYTQAVELLLCPRLRQQRRQCYNYSMICNDDCNGNVDDEFEDNDDDIENPEND